MKIALAGLGRCGKTTVFNALGSLPGTNTGGHGGVTPVSLRVCDERVDRLAERYRPRKTTYATIELVDFSGIAPIDPTAKNPFPPELLAMMKTADALAIVLRNFDDDCNAPPSPEQDLATVLEEFMLSDLIIAEKRLETVRQAYKRGQKTPALMAEEKLLQGIIEHLGASRVLTAMQLGSAEEKLIRGFQFLSGKPSFVIVNSSEERFGSRDDLLREIRLRYPAVEFAGRFEAELAQLDPAEKPAFMADMNIGESAVARLSTIAYASTGLISFFTVGDDEVRAWELPRGSSAVLAAGKIHSDLARGFIRAECFSFDDLVTLGSEKTVREKGKMRLEGKEYVVCDGDILSIRFNA